MTTTHSDTPAVALDRERRDLLESFARHRFFLTFTMRGLTDEQAATRSTVSELTLSGILRHVTETEAMWADFIVNGPDAMTAEMARWMDPESGIDHGERWRLRVGHTLADALEEYAAVAARTDDLIRTLPSLDVDQPLPVAPWFERDARWTARRVLLQLIAETAQHSGHADIIRESIDGQKTMG